MFLKYHWDQKVLFDQKWKKFLWRSWLFRYIPFIDFVLAAGSMALGNVKSESDFDVIVAAKSGRIFTARFFSVLAFSLFGWRRKKLSHRESATDKICLNHFVTEKSFQLSPPRNHYWQALYKNLVPILGEPEKISQFWKANQEWMEQPQIYQNDLRHQNKKSIIKKILETVLGGKLGAWLEKFLKSTQIKRIERGLKNDGLGYQPRIIYNDNELEFHPDTQRIQNFLQN